MKDRTKTTKDDDDMIAGTMGTGVGGGGGKKNDNAVDGCERK